MDYMQQKKIEFQLEKFKLPARYARPLISWDMLTDLTVGDRAYAVKYVETFPSSVKESLWLSNKKSGTGKTSVAICIVLDLIRAGKFDGVPMFVSFRVLMETMRQDREGSFLDNDLFWMILQSPLTIFDDMGVERVTASVADRYMLLVEQLWLKRKRAIFTSKFTLNKFLNRGGDTVEQELLDSIGSRLVGMCDEYVLENERDYRDG